MSIHEIDEQGCRNMAALSVDDDRLHLHLTTREKLAGLHGDIEVPISDIRDVRIEPDPIVAARGLRAPGLAIPGRAKIGTWRRRGRRRFVVARRGVPAVCVTLANGKYEELLVSTSDAERIAAVLGARLAGGAGQTPATSEHHSTGAPR